MPHHGGYFGTWTPATRPARIGRPRRDRAKIKAGRRAARR